LAAPCSASCDHIATHAASLATHVMATLTWNEKQVRITGLSFWGEWSLSSTLTRLNLVDREHSVHHSPNQFEGSSLDIFISKRLMHSPRQKLLRECWAHHARITRAEGILLLARL
jgi:hypothetical protein